MMKTESELSCGYAAHVENDGQPQKTGLPTFPTIAWATQRCPHIHKTDDDYFPCFHTKKQQKKSLRR